MMARRLVVFSDPGGAKPCLTLAEQWAALDEVLVCSDRQYAFFDNFAVKVTPARGANAAAIFDEFRPDRLFTGTSYTSRIETDFIREAALRHVHSTAFVDHYTGFDVRFHVADAVVVPNEVHVVDESAQSLAIAAGLPPHVIRITNNPYHCYLTKWRSALSKVVLFERLRIPLLPVTTILFAPDPLSHAGGVERFGTDEVATSRLLMDALRGADKPFHVLLKPHPNQSLDYLLNGLEVVPPNVTLQVLPPESDTFLNDLIYHVDAVVGMISNVLSEAEAMGKQTLRIEAGFRDTIINWPRPQAPLCHHAELKARLASL